MRHGGKKWSGSHVPIQFSFSFRERFWTRFARVEKAEEWEQHHHSFLSSSSKRRRRQRRRRRRSWCATACVPWVRRKKGGIGAFPWRFFAEKLSHVKYHKEEAKISSSLERTERDQKHEKERERAFLFFKRFFIYLTALPNHVCCFYNYALFYARFYANATF